ncbi:MAG: SDR family NAD(P)-dependent oxidoreductase [Flavobacterium sp.]|nr:MAG: SDR family NAD(P)-dependent oxidoreductase [Flavobacterium sp.]
MLKILIITGGSKGIGKGIVDAYLANDYQIYTISRSLNKALTTATQIKYDLSKTEGIKDLLFDLFKNIKSNEVEKITLINNAGTLGKIGKIEDINDIENTVKLNTITPLIINSAFIALTKNWKAEKHIINISSGAAYKPYSGWTVYCSSKAAIDMMTQTIALEQEEVENGAKVIAIYPGVVDTEMQAEIRKSDKANFASIDRFLDLKKNNALANATTVGKQIFDLDHSNIKNGSLIRLEE